MTRTKALKPGLTGTRPHARLSDAQGQNGPILLAPRCYDEVEGNDQRSSSQTTSITHRTSTFGAPEPADKVDYNKVQRSHLQKMDLGKSSSSCRVSLVTRLHRGAKKQEFWCASWEEAQVYINLAAHPDVLNFREQLTRVDYLDRAGAPRHTRIDAHVLMRDFTEVLVSVKYHEKATRASYLAEVEAIASQCDKSVADSFCVLSRFNFNCTYRDNAHSIHLARRGWDPEADERVLEVAQTLGDEFTFGELIIRSGLEARGYRAAVRVIGDGDILKDMFDAFDGRTVCRRVAV